MPHHTRERYDKKSIFGPHARVAIRHSRTAILAIRKAYPLPDLDAIAACMALAAAQAPEQCRAEATTLETNVGSDVKVRVGFYGLASPLEADTTRLGVCQECCTGTAMTARSDHETVPAIKPAYPYGTRLRQAHQRLDLS